jgi:hypothetical protein
LGATSRTRREEVMKPINERLPLLVDKRTYFDQFVAASRPSNIAGIARRSRQEPSTLAAGYASPTPMT